MKLEDVTVMDLATDPRQSLGEQVPFFLYRYISLFAVADSRGAYAEKSLFDGGYKAGSQLVREMMFVDVPGLIEFFRQNGIAIVTVESTSGATRMVRLEECATCTGLPPVEMSLCHLEAGLLAGALQHLDKSSAPYGARETECAGLGNSSCLFEVGPDIVMHEEG